MRLRKRGQNSDFRTVYGLSMCCLTSLNPKRRDITHKYHADTHALSHPNGRPETLRPRITRMTTQLRNSVKRCLIAGFQTQPGFFACKNRQETSQQNPNTSKKSNIRNSKSKTFFDRRKKNEKHPVQQPSVGRCGPGKGDCGKCPCHRCAGQEAEYLRILTDPREKFI